jgi:thermostable 8-oxoguanine DNA glycosylase
MLKGMHDLMSETELFLEMKEKPPQPCEHDWMCELAFCIDVTQHTNELDINIQEANHLVNEMFDKITVFERKLRLWEQQLQPNNTTHFPIMRTEKCIDAKIYVEKIQLLQQEFNSCFQGV